MKIILVFILSYLSCYAKCEQNPYKKDLEDDYVRNCDTQDCRYHARPIPLSQKNEKVSNTPDRSSNKKCADTSYPGYENIINTNFTCKGKPYLPGFYADMETNCQIFHVCYNSIAEHFLCPNGTVFDQKNLVCNRCQQVQCKQSALFYHANLNVFQGKVDVLDEEVRNSLKNKLIFAAPLSNDKDSPEEGNENKYLKLLILTQLMEVSDILSDVLKFQVSEENERLGRSFPGAYSEILNRHLTMVIADVFPLLPVKFNVSVVDGLGKPEERIVERVRQPRSVPMSKETSKNVPELVHDIIDETSGIISGVSRNVLASNYITFFATLHATKNQK